MSEGIAKNHPKPSQGVSEQFGPSIHKMKGFSIAIEVAIYRMGNGPGAKIPEKWERKWKMAPRPKWPKNGRRNGKNRQNQDRIPFSDPFFHFDCHFRPFRAWGHFPFSFPFFWDFCSGPVSHSVNGHFNRNFSRNTPRSSPELRPKLGKTNSCDTFSGLTCRSIQNGFRQTFILRAKKFQLQIQNCAAGRMSFHYRNRSVESCSSKFSGAH